jgi:protein TonB
MEAPQRRPEPPRRPPPDRYERVDHIREPSRGEGGPLRAFVLIALLGGAALAGGLYFGGGVDFGANAPEGQVADASPAYPYDEPADALDEPIGVPLEDTTTPPAQRRVETAARREPAATPATAPPPRRSEPEVETSTPAPVTSWNSASSGPTSLSPGQRPANTSNNAPSTVVPLTPPAVNPTTTPASTPTRSAPARAGTVVWAQRPSARRVADLYPDRAAREGAGGRVELDCSVRTNQTLSCSVASETPTGMGFGRAALNASSSYRAQPWLSDGSDSSGARTRVVFQFQAPEQ